MSEKLLTREWVGVGLVLGAILTIFIVSKISEKRITGLIEKAISEVKTAPLPTK